MQLKLENNPKPDDVQLFDDDTLNFQAPAFHVKHGYTVWGQLDNFPPEHQRIFYVKMLQKSDR